MNSMDCYFDLPVMTVVDTKSVLGSSTIFVADTFIPFLRASTVAGLPSTVN